MREENGEDTKNARIKIDYSKKMPKVTFSYPSKEHQITGSMFWYILIFWALIFLLVGFYTSILYSSIDTEEDTFLTGINMSNYNLSNYDSYLKLVNDSKMLEDIYYNINNVNKKDLKSTLKEELSNKENYIFWVVSLLTIVMSFLTYFPFRKQWNRIYPKFQGFLARKKYTKLNKNDIQLDQKENKYYVELPIFNNVILNYKATKDFSKYLTLFEIEEHKFKYYPLRKYKILKKMSKKKKERIKKEKKKYELNEFIWYARFYFNNKPIKGYIEIIYK